MQKLLITGGAGFIGSAVIRYLIKHTQHQVINLDKLTYAGNLENLTEVSSNKRYTFEQVDICDAAEIKRVLQQHQPNIIMHLAAESHVDRSIDGPAAFIETNILGTYTLLEAAREYWNTLPKTEQQTFRFHHVSTDEVYGDLPHPDDAAKTATSAKPPRSDELPLFTETTAYAPSSPYSASKASSDHLVRAWQRTYGLPIVVTNCSNNYGPYHFPEKLIPHVILNALAGKSLPIYGDGSQIRDWLYVEDHAEALVLVATQGKNGQTYNIGGHNEKRNLEVVETICQILDELRPLKTATSATPPRSDDISPVVANNPPVIASGSEAISSYKQLITHVADRPGHDRRYAIDASKIEQEFGWKPKETFETGLRKTVQWYLDNEAWWQNVLNGNYRLTRIGTNNT